MMNRNILLFLLINFLSFAAIAKEVATPVFDNRGWKLGWSAKEEADKLKKPYDKAFDEYVLPGENVQTWTELVTLQFFPTDNPRATVDAFEAINKSELLKTCPNANWNVIYRKDTDVMWEWDIKNCEGQADQSEMARTVKTKEGLHVFHYAIKKSPMPAESKKEWEKNLKAFTIK